MNRGQLAIGIPQEEMDQIFKSDLPELEKVRRAFDRITGFIVSHARNEVELARAMQDREEVVKTQIKMSTIESARGIFDMCYRRATGRRVWDD